MKINFDIGNFIHKSLPIHMIQPNRMDLYWLVIREINKIWENYRSFRNLKYIEQNITYSKRSLEWWLNYRIFDSGDSNKLIIIVDPGNPYYMALETKDPEGNDYIELSQKSDGKANVKLSQEGDSFGIDTSFAVKSQTILQSEEKEQINLIVEQFRPAGVDYQIID